MTAEKYTISAAGVALTVKSKGAEMCSITKNGREYLWNADPAFWNRSSPLLFPIVGTLRNNEYSYGGKQYHMTRHGFARDNVFTLEDQTADSLRFTLRDTPQTFAMYPFHFLLCVTYRLSAGGVTVQWEVTDTGTDALYFSIGAHPAFRCAPEAGGKAGTSLVFAKNGKLLSSVDFGTINADGLSVPATVRCALDNGKLPVTVERFARDVLICGAADEIGLADSDGTVYVRVKYDAPLAGLWTPAGKNAPFICIEPWYGRADAATFTGTLAEREWGTVLQPGKTFEKKYEICL